MEKKIKYWWLILLKGIVLILLAFYIFQHPVKSLVVLALYLGIGLFITGIFLIIAAVSLRNISENWGWRLAEGIVDIAFAIILLSNPGITAVVFPLVIGLWIITYGILVISASFNVKKDGVKEWWMGLLGGIAAVIIGYFVTANPLAGAVAITFWIALGFFALGFVSIVASLALRKIKIALKAPEE